LPLLAPNYVAIDGCGAIWRPTAHASFTWRCSASRGSFLVAFWAGMSGAIAACIASAMDTFVAPVMGSKFRGKRWLWCSKPRWSRWHLAASCACTFHVALLTITTSCPSRRSIHVALRGMRQGPSSARGVHLLRPQPWHAPGRAGAPPVGAPRRRRPACNRQCISQHLAE
jgi:hypothetical protein